MVKIIQRTLVEQHSLPDDMHPILSRVYRARGVSQIEQLDKELTALLPYDNLSGLSQAVERLACAIKEQQRIVIVGDFDADGATSSALAVSALKSFGAQYVDYLVPNRFDYGYGLTPEIVAVAQKLYRPDLLITVDNGISSISGAEAANKLGISVIVTDHHLPGEYLPAVEAIVNPNLPEDAFASKNLAGVGVVFYVMLALRSYLRDQNHFSEHHLPLPNMAELLDLVALGTIADVVPLDKNNRVLVHQGLRRIRAGRVRPGIKALVEVAGRSLAELTAMDLAFAVAPRLNAAGRLDDMSIGIAGLLTQDLDYATAVAQQLDQLNTQRREIETTMQSEAALQLKSFDWSDLQDCPSGICLYNPDWHQGVIGILASRVKDKTNRPVIVFAKSQTGELKGSGRSVKGLHMRDLLQKIDVQCPGLIHKFGGHAMAAGLTLAESGLKQFKQTFIEVVSAQVTADMLEHSLYSDGALSVEQANLTLAYLLRDIEPWGQNFPEPVFDGEFCLLEQRLLKERHLKMQLTWPGDSRVIDAIAFNVDLAHWPNYRCQRVHLLYRLSVNYYNERQSLQLLVVDMQPVLSQ